MKRKITLAVIGLASMAVGFLAGRLVQHNKSGYHFEVRDTKNYDTSVGPIRWSYVTESIGMPFLDTGTTVLELEGRTIYKAKRAFQESSPYAKNISTNQNGIAWDDGDFQFHLTIHRLKTGEHGGGDDRNKPSN